MKTLILWTMLLSYSSQVLSAPVLVQTLGSSKEEYQGFLESQNKHADSFIQNYFDVSASSEKSQKITELYEDGLKYFFSGARKMAEKNFSEIISYAYDAEWAKNQVSMIFMSFIRLAEIYPERGEKYIQRALYFRYDYDEEIPSSVSAAVTKVKKNMKLKAWDISSYKNFDFVVVNSQVYDLNSVSKINLPNSEHRVTFLSNLFTPQTYRMYPQQLAMISAPTIPIIDGNCDNPSSSLETAELTAYFSKSCILTRNSGKWSNYKDSKQLDLAPSAGNSFSSYQFPSEPIYKKVWFWAAIGVVAGVVLINANKKESSSQQTETVTF